MRQAAAYAVEQLLATDRVSITFYDEAIETLVLSTLASDKPALISRIRTIHSRGSSDLHGGWLAGINQVTDHILICSINRVLLMADGFANAGVVDPAVIESDVKAKSEIGVGTITLGVGNDFNEFLLEGMARAGDGNL